ncbi:MAG: hypothetical protein KY454_05085 [Actinobacteria bacterium]|nr:hypothetical protein [Actinomycetota bacterium]MBW3649328.1 hypothetical protein [Actinomycetota bacterium]
MALKRTLNGALSPEDPAAGTGGPGAAQTTIQALLEPGTGMRSAAGSGRLTADDPVSAFAALESDGRFRRDTGIGRIFHARSLSLREVSRASSLHISITGNRISAHVDRFSPLGRGARGMARYSLRSIAVHNAAGMAEDLVRLFRGRQGHHRSHLDCQWLWPQEVALEAAAAREVGAAHSGVQLEVAVGVHLDQGRLIAAMADALGREEAEVPLTVQECPDDQALAEVREQLQYAEVPLTKGPPLRAVLVRLEDGDLFMLNINHAAADGPGALHVVRTIARAYARGGKSPARLEFLASSDLPVRPARANSFKGRQGYRIMMEKVRDLLSPPARMTSEGSKDEPGFGFHHVRLTEDQTRELAERGGGGSEEELLLAALHLAVSEWNAGHGRSSEQVSVLVTNDLRPDGWDANAVGNFSITARISTSRNERADPREAVRSVTAETARNRRNHRGRALIGGLDRAGLIGLWAKQSTTVLLPLSGNRLVDTALLSDLGPLPDPDWFGAEVGAVSEVWFSLPPREPVGLSVGAVTLSKRLHLSFRYRHRLFGADAAARFAECYVAQLQRVTVG